VKFRSVGRDADLLEIVGAPGAAGHRARRRHGRQQEDDEEADDRDLHRQLDRREAAASTDAG
jgi:hypothetical protein